ncbi:hypothetical protein GCM10010349_23340 [Streptomyces flavofungini]|nr:hypothetical protein GCM10010349_23340 [Streptomyces flavofungini]
MGDSGGVAEGASLPVREGSLPPVEEEVPLPVGGVGAVAPRGVGAAVPWVLWGARCTGGVVSCAVADGVGVGVASPGVAGVPGAPLGPLGVVGAGDAEAGAEVEVGLGARGAVARCTWGWAGGVVVEGGVAEGRVVGGVGDLVLGVGRGIGVPGALGAVGAVGPSGPPGELGAVGVLCGVGVVSRVGRLEGVLRSAGGSGARELPDARGPLREGEGRIGFGCAGVAFRCTGGVGVGRGGVPGDASVPPDPAERTSADAELPTR